jgi:excisionase family DNA binding protein
MLSYFDGGVMSGNQISGGLVSIDQVASLLDCHTMTVRRLIKAGELGEVVRMGHKFVRIRRQAVDDYIDRHSEPVKGDG